MRVKVRRSASQILFGYLPGQTVDLNQGIWKVEEWRHATKRGDVDNAGLVRELKRLATPWRLNGKDNNLTHQLERGADVAVLSLDRTAGVKVAPFPEVYFCGRCKRMLSAFDSQCTCGATGRPQQLHFVGYCASCGTVREPYVKPCPQHHVARIRFPGTASAGEIRFDCPVCERMLQKGFGFPKCSCGGTVQFNVHRAASVYTPRSVVIVNPPSRAQIEMLAAAGGDVRALEWVLNGMREQSVRERKPTRTDLRQDLLSRGLSKEIVDAMIAAIGDKSPSEVETPDVDLSATNLELPREQAVTIALAASQSRIRVEDLSRRTDPMSELRVLYTVKYPVALQEAGLEGVELIDQFPVLTGQFGYTRGSADPGASTLVPFRSQRSYVVYGEVAQTEALFVRLEPRRVARWLSLLGHDVGKPRDAREARLTILAHADIPAPGMSADSGVGKDLLTLIHTYCHRFIRQASVFAGIERNALSELLVPLHLGFYVYAAVRGDFVLGGLQAVFETELDQLLEQFTRSELRCPLDPGCGNAGGACAACVHLGEPSCRYFNGYLSRNTLAGVSGYLSARLM